MRLVALLRCPIERAWSQWRLEFSRGNETLEFSEAIRRERERSRGRPAGAASQCSPTTDRGFHSGQFRRLRRFFHR